jgi:hypothetical protein
MSRASWQRVKNIYIHAPDLVPIVSFVFVFIFYSSPFSLCSLVTQGEKRNRRYISLSDAMTVPPIYTNVLLISTIQVACHF